jgi:glutathione S-transferase
MLRLHDNATSGNAYKIRLLLTQLGLGFERIEYDTDRGATRTPEFLSTKNANGRIPVLELEDGRCLPESNAILWYLAEGTRFVPGAANDQGRWLRAEVLQWMFFEQYSHEPNIATVRAWITHHVEMTPERQAALPGKRKQGVAALEVMERHLTTRRFFVGERTPSPTSRSTRTRTWRMKAASTCRRSAPSARGSSASPPSPVTSPSRHRAPRRDRGPGSSDLSSSGGPHRG